MRFYSTDAAVYHSAEAAATQFKEDVALARQGPPQFQSYRLEYHYIPWMSESEQEEEASRTRGRGLEIETEPEQHIGQYEGEVFGCDDTSGQGGQRIGHIKFIKIYGEEIYGMGHTLG